MWELQVDDDRCPQPQLGAQQNMTTWVDTETDDASHANLCAAPSHFYKVNDHRQCITSFISAIWSSLGPTKQLQG